MTHFCIVTTNIYEQLNLFEITYRAGLYCTELFPIWKPKTKNKKSRILRVHIFTIPQCTSEFRGTWLFKTLFLFTLFHNYRHMPQPFQIAYYIEYRFLLFINARGSRVPSETITALPLFDPRRLLYHNNNVTLERKFSKGMTGWLESENAHWSKLDSK